MSSQLNWFFCRLVPVIDTILLIQSQGPQIASNTCTRMYIGKLAADLDVALRTRILVIYQFLGRIPHGDI